MKTCSLCENHACTFICEGGKQLCNGNCIFKGKTKCYESICNCINFKKDKFFKNVTKIS